MMRVYFGPASQREPGDGYLTATPVMPYVAAQVRRVYRLARRAGIGEHAARWLVTDLLGVTADVTATRRDVDAP